MRKLLVALVLTGCFTPNIPPAGREIRQARVCFAYEIPDLLVTDNVGEIRPFRNWVVFENVSVREALFLFKRDYPSAEITDQW